MECPKSSILSKIYSLAVYNKGKDTALAVQRQRRRNSRRYTKILSFYQGGKEDGTLDQKIAHRRMRKSLIKPHLKRKNKVQLGDKDDSVGSLENCRKYMPGRKMRVDSFFATNTKLAPFPEKFVNQRK